MKSSVKPQIVVYIKSEGHPESTTSFYQTHGDVLVQRLYKRRCLVMKVLLANTSWQQNWLKSSNKPQVQIQRILMSSGKISAKKLIFKWLLTWIEYGENRQNERCSAFYSFNVNKISWVFSFCIFLFRNVTFHKTVNIKMPKAQIALNDANALPAFLSSVMQWGSFSNWSKHAL